MLEPGAKEAIVLLRDIVEDEGRKLIIPRDELNLSRLSGAGKMEFKLAEDWHCKITELIDGASLAEQGEADDDFEPEEDISPSLRERMEQQKRAKQINYVAGNLERSDRMRAPNWTFYDVQRHIWGGYASAAHVVL